MDVAGKPNGPLFKGQAVPKRRQQTTTLRYIKSQKIADLIYAAAEAICHVHFMRQLIGKFRHKALTLPVPVTARSKA
jgi:hypothetical protein